MKFSQQNYYDVLEVSSSAPPHIIHEAYLKAKVTYSPESPALYTMFTKEEAQELLVLIEEAFLVLSDQTKRRQYDEYLKSGNPIDGQLQNFPDLTVESANGAASTPNAAISLVGVPQPVKASTEVPEGFAKTRLSVYEVNETLEEEIKNSVNFPGSLLQQIRQYKNLNLEQLSRETKISKGYIAAIEAEDYDALPANVFVRGFVVQIARILGLDDNKVANSYMGRLKQGRQ